jgi:hypothetical protein
MNARSLSLARAVSVIGGTTALIIGATFAATWNNTATLSGSTFSSETAGVSIASYDNTNNLWSALGATAPGLSIVLKPGVSDPYYFQLKNTGSAKLSISASAPSIAATLAAAHIDASTITVHVYDSATEVTPGGGVTLASLAGGGSTPIGTFTTGELHQYKITFTSTPDTITGAGGSTTSGIDLNFVGTPVE